MEGRGYFIRNGVKFAGSSGSARNVDYEKEDGQTTTVQNELTSLNDSLNQLVVTKYDTESGKPMWKDSGADTWNFFKSDVQILKNAWGKYTYTVAEDAKVLIFHIGLGSVPTSGIKINSTDVTTQFTTQYSGNNTHYETLLTDVSVGDVITNPYEGMMIIS